MNRSAVKSLVILLFGVALGLGIGRLPERGDRIGAEKNQSPEAAAPNGQGAHAGGGIASNTKGVPGTGAAGEKSGRPRPEALLDILRNKDGREELGAFMTGMMTIAEMSAEEIGPVMELLTEKDTDFEIAIPLATRWGMLDPKAALASAMGRPELKANERLITSIIQELAGVDLPAAKEALAHLANEERRDGGRAIVKLLQRKDPQAALAYARELKDSKAEAGALMAIAGNDPLAAAAELKPGMGDYEEVVKAIASSLLRKDPAAFDTWLGSLGDPAQRAVARSTALTWNATADPKGAALETAAWLAQEPEASAQTGDLPARIAQRWIQDKGPPAEVAAWAAGLPEGPAREKAVTEVGRLWVKQDTMAASGWLSSLPQGEGRDMGVFYLVQKISGETPADAFEWARTVESAAYRNEALCQSVQSWARQDAAAAQEAVQALPAGDQIYLQPLLEAERKAKERK